MSFHKTVPVMYFVPILKSSRSVFYDTTFLPETNRANTTWTKKCIPGINSRRYPPQLSIQLKNSEENNFEIVLNSISAFAEFLRFYANNRNKCRLSPEFRINRFLPGLVRIICRSIFYV